MKIYFKIIETVLISFCFRWVVCVSSVEHEHFYRHFSPLPTHGRTTNYSLHSRHIRDKRPISGLMVYRSQHHYKHISKTAPDTLEKPPVDVDHNYHVQNTREAVPSDRVNYEIFPLRDTSASQEYPSRNIGDEEVYSTTRIFKQTVVNLKGNGRFHSKIHATPAPLGFNSWKAPWPPKRGYNMQVHPAKYFEDILTHETPPTSVVNTPIYTLLTTTSLRKTSPRRDILGYRGFKIIGAVVDMNHKPRREVYRNIIRGRVHTTSSQNPILYSTIEYVKPNIVRHSSVKRSVEETPSVTYEKGTTTLDEGEIGYIDKEDIEIEKEVIKPSTAESDRVRFFEYFDRRRQDEGEGESELGRHPELSSSMQTTEEPPSDASEALHDIRRHITEAINPSQHRQDTTWHHHPYMALYIFEPEGIHCDAAGISAHWLVASAACLLQYVPPEFGVQGSQPTGNLAGNNAGKEAAYVTYCGDRWDQPERITYVRYVTVHPRYQKEEGPLKVAYNIGVVRVVNSMAACGAWRALAVWSHRVSAAGALPAVAVGWRLNRVQGEGCEGAGGCRAIREARLAADPVTLHSGKCHNVSRDVFEDEGETRRRHGRVGSVYCVRARCGEPAQAARCAGAGVLLAGGRLLGMWLKERQSGAGEMSVEYSATWRASAWLRGAARDRT